MDNDQRIRLLKEDISGAFDPVRFAASRLPVHAGSLQDMAAASDLPSCLDMLVMLPTGELTLPEPYASCNELNQFLSKCILFEDKLLPGWRQNYHLYLTVDTRTVMPGQTHRNAGWHFDGMQGSRYPRKIPVCHQYVISNVSPTHYCDLPLQAEHLSEQNHNWFEELGSQIPGNHKAWTPKAHSIMCMSAYQLHQSPEVIVETKRTFIRLDVSLKQQDRLGNTINPALPAPFKYVERKLPEGLSRRVRDASWKNSVRYQKAG